MISTAVVVMIAGCSSTEPGQPSATIGSDPTNSVTSGVDGRGGHAPRVRVPLNDARLVSDPCSALSTPQLQGIGFTGAIKTTVKDLAVGNVCSWDDDSIGTVGASVGVAVQTTLVHGLSDIYAQHATLAYFLPVTINGYPAVLAGTEDQRSTGTCDLNLGVSDTSVLSIEYDQMDLGSSACDQVQALARAVVETLQGG